MPITISVVDSLRQSVEAASGGRNTVLYDAAGLPSIMVIVPRYMIPSVGVHPAFVVNGDEKREIFIAKYQATVHSGVGVSLPNQVPTTNVTFDAARGYCTAKGAGWHLMTNAEWGAILWWYQVEGYKASWVQSGAGTDIVPLGNTNYGASNLDSYSVGRRSDNRQPGDTSQAGVTLSGSGPNTWSHDFGPTGICDLIGNVWEWVGGLRLNNGEIQIIPQNTAALASADQSATSGLWQGIKADGSIVAPGTTGTLKYDSTTAGTSGLVGTPQIDDVIDNSNDPGGGTDNGYTATPFKDLVADTGITPPAVMQHLALYYGGNLRAGDGPPKIYVRNYGERVGMRGGAYDEATGGYYSLDLRYKRSYSAGNVGFRPAFVL